MSDFKVNDFLTLKFSYPSTNIYICGKYFMQCKRLILNIPKSEVKEYKHVESIDEAVEVYDHTVYEHEIFKANGLPEVENDENFTLIDPEEEFWGHCSNLQVWVEHDYDTRLLKANLAFPLLERLAKVGDKIAQIKFKEEIIKRLLSGATSVVEYLFVEGYQDDLTNEELFFGLLEPSEAETLLQIQQELNLIFMFVPTIDRNVGLRHPEDPSMSYEEKRSIRGFSIENKCVKGLQFTFAEILKLPIGIHNFKELKQISLKRSFSELNSDEIIRAIQDLEGIQEIFLSSSLKVNLDNTRLKNIKKIGKKFLHYTEFPIKFLRFNVKTLSLRFFLDHL